MKRIDKEVAENILAWVIVLAILTGMVVFCYRCYRDATIRSTSVEYTVEVTYLDDTRKVFTYRAGINHDYGLISNRSVPAVHVNVGGKRYKPEYNVKNVTLLSKKNVL